MSVAINTEEMAALYAVSNGVTEWEISEGHGPGWIARARVSDWLVRVDRTGSEYNIELEVHPFHVSAFVETPAEIGPAFKRLVASFEAWEASA